METLVKLASETKSGENLVKEAFGMPGVGLAIKGYQRVSASKAMKAIARAMGKAKATSKRAYKGGMRYAKKRPGSTALAAGAVGLHAGAAMGARYGYKKKKMASDEVSTICKEAMQSANEAAEIL